MITSVRVMEITNRADKWGAVLSTKAHKKWKGVRKMTMYHWVVPRNANVFLAAAASLSIIFTEKMIGLLVLEVENFKMSVRYVVPPQSVLW